MRPEIRRIIAIEAHRRRTGRVPVRLHSMGTGETFAVEPSPDGFVDLTSGMRARPGGSAIQVEGESAPIALQDTDDVTASGYDPASRTRFTVRASGGVSVTVLADGRVDYYQFAVDEAEE